MPLRDCGPSGDWSYSKHDLTLLHPSRTDHQQARQVVRGAGAHPSSGPSPHLQLSSPLADKVRSEQRSTSSLVLTEVAGPGQCSVDEEWVVD